MQIDSKEAICMECQSLVVVKNNLETVWKEFQSIFLEKNKKNISECRLLNLSPFLS